MLQAGRPACGNGSLGSDAQLCELSVSHVLLPIRLLSTLSNICRYHDSVENWEFGKLSAMQEIALAVEGGYNYYYMGICLAGPSTAYELPD